MKRILILACSATKQKDRGLMPAFLRYDGPAWRTLRANLAERSDVVLLALSAEHGLIAGDHPIEDYDRRMTSTRARELIDPVSDTLEELGRAGQLDGEILFFGGRHYRETIEAARDLAQCELERTIPISFTRGGIGEQLGQLKAWLRRDK